MAESRITQVVLEAIGAASVEAWVTQSVAEVGATSTRQARITQVVLEAIGGITGLEARVTQIVAEVATPRGGGGRRRVWFTWW